MNDYPIKVAPDVALRLLLENAAAPKTENVNLWSAVGRVLAKDIVTTIPTPPFDRSSFDGFAFRSEDVRVADREHPVTLRIMESILAGENPTKTVLPGTAVRIMTGAPIPPGADAIRKYEWTEYDHQQVRMYSPAKSGENIVRAGEDVPKGQLLAVAGTRIDGSLPGLLATQGLDSVLVYRRPVATIVNTGTEIVPLGRPRPEYSVYNSSLYNVAAFLNRQGLLPMNGGIVEDKPEKILERLDEVAPLSDVIITTGGVSVGDADFMPAVMEQWGARVLFWKLSMKPGGAMLAAVKDGKVILCLSGNPGAAMLGLMRVALPFLLRLCGRSDCELRETVVKLKEPLDKESVRTRILRGRLSVENGEAWLTRSETQGPGDLSSLLGCDILGEIPAGSGPVESDTPIKAYIY